MNGEIGNDRLVSVRERQTEQAQNLLISDIASTTVALYFFRKSC